MLVYLNLALERREGLASGEGRTLGPQDVEDAVVEGALLRLRPKAMTVAAIFAGLLPIMLGSGPGTEVMRRSAAPLGAVMATATLLPWLVSPAVFLVWQRYRLRRRGAAAVGE